LCSQNYKAAHQAISQMLKMYIRIKNLKGAALGFYLKAKILCKYRKSNAKDLAIENFYKAGQLFCNAKI